MGLLRCWMSSSASSAPGDVAIWQAEILTRRLSEKVGMVAPREELDRIHYEHLCHLYRSLGLRSLIAVNFQRATARHLAGSEGRQDNVRRVQPGVAPTPRATTSFSGDLWLDVFKIAITSLAVTMTQGSRRRPTDTYYLCATEAQSC